MMFLNIYQTMISMKFSPGKFLSQNTNGVGVKGLVRPADAKRRGLGPLTPTE